MRAKALSTPSTSNRSVVFSTRGRRLPCWLLFLCAWGCSAPEEPIVTYQVTKHAAIQRDISDPVDGDPQRLLAAIVLDGDQAWFFKASEPAEAYPDAVGDAFDQLLTTVKFENPNKPSWDLGDGWTEQPGSGMRAANLVLDGITFSVIKLPVPPNAKERQYILDNVNRWRGQVRLPNLSSADLASQSHKISTADGHDAIVVDFTGTQSGSSMAAPFANAPFAGGGSSLASRPAAAASSRASTFTDSAPDSWKPQSPGMMQEAKYTVTQGDASADISVSRAAGQVLANVNRWRGQVGLNPVASEEEAGAREVTVSSLPGKLFRFDGETKSMVVAMIPKGSGAWFFKLFGNKVVVEKEATAFEAYLSTIKIK